MVHLRVTEPRLTLARKQRLVVEVEWKDPKPAGSIPALKAPPDSEAKVTIRVLPLSRSVRRKLAEGSKLSCFIEMPAKVVRGRR